ncbi:MAG: methyltransferase, TIGR04325 family [Pseudomonadota bacterium]
MKKTLHQRKISTWARRWLPQGLRDALNRAIGYAIYFRGDYPDWAAAKADASGYDEGSLLSRLKDAALAVKSGAAAWEQDGVVWEHIPLNMPILAMLSRVALSDGGRLSVLDFGGGLGSSYFQCRDFLRPVAQVSWTVVEQPNLAKIGREDIARDDLRFYDDLDLALKEQNPNVFIFSGVLQYLPNPWSILSRATSTGAKFLIIDRHPCSINNEKITVQVIPSHIYAASYPCWIFDCAAMKNKLLSNYELLAEWIGKDPPIRGHNKEAEYRGYFFQLRHES